ncbi:sulfur carrier protein ThiS [Saccharothrix sp. 6-C]|uniref:Sulfur carrier protein n=1 Tax=Saccharothrix texasensis TaxID=103734 RepID=A0A3N1H8P4_9PSEU|nr:MULTISPECIES: sulfur carrier protein ThiS [Saccharothrix]QQQ76849.1 sulfur carrier protein ThiS [Saccharothrix sp. 6-C]ROP38838.1 sulfur carrier protein [Saccharothrix texasensis]
MKAKVNGLERELADGSTVATVLALLDAPPRGVAVAVDGEVVPRAAWDTTTLADGAAVEVLTAVQGG